MKQHIISIEYHTSENWKELESRQVELFNEAFAALDKAYAPYSSFKVGAVVEFADGGIEVGNNQENAAYPSGLCAERVALFSALAKYPSRSIKALYVVTEESRSTPAAPCGSCRQVIMESASRQEGKIELYLASRDGSLTYIPDANALLPFGFGPEALKKG